MSNMVLKAARNAGSPVKGHESSTNETHMSEKELDIEATQNSKSRTFSRRIDRRHSRPAVTKYEERSHRRDVLHRPQFNAVQAEYSSTLASIILGLTIVLVGAFIGFNAAHRADTRELLQPLKIRKSSPGDVASGSNLPMNSLLAHHASSESQRASPGKFLSLFNFYNPAKNASSTSGTQPAEAVPHSSRLISYILVTLGLILDWILSISVSLSLVMSGTGRKAPDVRERHGSPSPIREAPRKGPPKPQPQPRRRPTLLREFLEEFSDYGDDDGGGDGNDGLGQDGGQGAGAVPPPVDPRFVHAPGLSSVVSIPAPPSPEALREEANRKKDEERQRRLQKMRVLAKEQALVDIEKESLLDKQREMAQKFKQRPKDPAPPRMSLGYPGGPVVLQGHR